MKYEMSAQSHMQVVADTADSRPEPPGNNRSRAFIGDVDRGSHNDYNNSHTEKKQANAFDSLIPLHDPKWRDPYRYYIFSWRRRRVHIDKLAIRRGS